MARGTASVFGTLYEIREDGEHTITYQPRRLPVGEYLSAHLRFQHLTKEDVLKTQKEID